jgi:hypothetical protein
LNEPNPAHPKVAAGPDYERRTGALWPAPLLVDRLERVLDRPIERVDRGVDMAEVLVIELDNVARVHVYPVLGSFFPFIYGRGWPLTSQWQR